MESPYEKAAPSRRRMAPPLRLAWPGGGDGGIGQLATLTSSQSSAASSQLASKRGIKRRRQATDTVSSSLWVDKYAPRHDASQLCVAPKKVKEVRSWIQAALEEITAAKNLLILVGGPGIGKSTMIRVLAAELKLDLHEWSDSHTNRTNHGSSGLLSVERASALQSFESFLQSAGAGYRSLFGSSSCNGMEQSNPKRTKDKEQARTYQGKALILLEELPNLYSAEAESQFREILGRHLRQSHVPTVLIFSDVCEGKHNPQDLERLIPTDLLYSPAARIMQCHAVTKAKLRKCLETIARKESVCVPTNFSDQVYLQCGGDLRHAINMLQFQKNGTQKSFHGEPSRHDRDAKLSTFHALGKLLYAKRKHPTQSLESDTRSEQRPPLEFNPERVMEQSDIGLGGALTFLGYHSPEFFTNMEELSQAFGHFSDAATFLDKCIDLQRDHGDSVYPGGYISSLAGRAVANANRHPAPNKFRSFGAPTVYKVMRKLQGNNVTMKQLCKRLSVGSQILSLNMNLGSSRSFVTDDLPFMRTILPHDVATAVNNLYSFVRSSEDTNEASQEGDHAMKLAALEQEQILAMDDIIDDDSEDEMMLAANGPTEQSPRRERSQDDKDSLKTTSPTSTVHEASVHDQPEIVVIDV